ncbi:MAG: four helix bundle protein [Candidatus Berkelbacteria bacterium]|nr:four helix bundle protein [Candidatus Berkelbacteria bacterium]
MLNPYLNNEKLNVKSNVKLRAFNLSLQIIQLCQKLPQSKIFWIITDQLVRAITSIGANIIEAKSSSSRRDFIKFYEIALKSANESEYWLWILHEIEGSGLEISCVENLLDELEQISKMIAKSLLTLKGKT